MGFTSESVLCNAARYSFKIEKDDSSWNPGCRNFNDTQNCAAFEGWIPKVNLLRLDPVVVFSSEKVTSGVSNVGFAARIKQTHTKIGLLLQPNINATKNIKTSKTKAICTVYQCLSTYVRSITRYNSGFSLHCRCLFVVFFRPVVIRNSPSWVLPSYAKPRGRNRGAGKLEWPVRSVEGCWWWWCMAHEDHRKMLSWILVLSWVSYIKLSKCYKTINYCSHWYCPFVVHLSLFLLLFL